jgi:hypothetical protein
LITKIKWPYQKHLCLEPILFFSFFFSISEHLITMAITTFMIITNCSTTWNVLPYLMITRANRLALGVYQFTKTKLELSIVPPKFLKTRGSLALAYNFDDIGGKGYRWWRLGLKEDGT